MTNIHHHDHRHRHRKGYSCCDGSLVACLSACLPACVPAVLMLEFKKAVVLGFALPRFPACSQSITRMDASTFFHLLGAEPFRVTVTLPVLQYLGLGAGLSALLSSCKRGHVIYYCRFDAALHIKAPPSTPPPTRPAPLPPQPVDGGADRPTTKAPPAWIPTAQLSLLGVADSASGEGGSGETPVRVLPQAQLGIRGEGIARVKKKSHPPFRARTGARTSGRSCRAQAPLQLALRRLCQSQRG